MVRLRSTLFCSTLVDRRTDDTFHIVVTETSASINGLRFGKSSKSPLEWPDFNAAWGQILLLLQALARKLAYEFKGHAYCLWSTMRRY